MDGCHRIVTAERGCEVNELGSLWTPPPTTRDQRAVAASTIEARRGRAGMVGGGGFAAEGALRLPIRAGRAAGSKEWSFFLRAHPALPEGRS